MVPAVVFIAKHQRVLERLGLLTLEQAQSFQGALVKNHRGHRDILKIDTRDETGRPLVLFLKRNLKPYKKDGLRSLLRHGTVWSMSRQEWENARLLAAKGLPVATPVAYGESCGPLWEHGSFLITEAAPGTETLLDFLRHCRQRQERETVLRHFALLVQALHQAGLATPDLFARHVFLNRTGPTPAFCLIDMARLDHRQRLSPRRRARGLAILHLSVPRRDARLPERLRFLKAYLPPDLSLPGMMARIGRRARHLLRRRRHRDFFHGRRAPQSAGGRLL